MTALSAFSLGVFPQLHLVSVWQTPRDVFQVCLFELPALSLWKHPCLLQEELLISVLAPVSFIFGLLVHFGVTSSCSGNDSKQLCLLSCLCAVSHDLEFYDGTPL